jgi:ABC-type transport system involved in cytochrome bd biosynthesis fused ATPase/permease subunit
MRQFFAVFMIACFYNLSLLLLTSFLSVCGVQVKDPPFLLLDEATSSLDRTSENEIIATLQRY